MGSTNAVRQLVQDRMEGKAPIMVVSTRFGEWPLYGLCVKTTAPTSSSRSRDLSRVGHGAHDRPGRGRNQNGRSIRPVPSSPHGPAMTPRGATSEPLQPQSAP